MNTKTKLTALLMSILMVVAMIPAFAIVTSAEEIPATAVAALTKGGTTTYYDTFKAAWDAVPTDGSEATLKLLKNTGMGALGWSNFPCGAGTKNCVLTLDLNGCVLTPPTIEEKQAHFYVTAGTLIVTDSQPKVKHWYSVNQTTGLYTWVEAAETDETKRTGLVELPGGALTGGCDDATTYGGGVFYVATNGSLEIRGGNFVGNTGGVAGVIRLYPNCAKAIKISGGLFIGNTVESGIYKNISNQIHDPSNKDYKGGTFSLSGGTFVGENGGVNTKSCAEGYNWVANKKYTDGFSVVPAIKFMGVQRSNNIGEGDSASYSLRLVATVKESLLEDGNAFAGFNIAVNGDEAKLASNFYYTQLNAQGVDGLNKVITPKYDGYVLIAVVIEAIPVDTNSDMTLTVTPYLTVDTVEQSPVRSANVVLSGTNEPVVTWAN